MTKTTIKIAVFGGIFLLFAFSGKHFEWFKPLVVTAVIYAIYEVYANKAAVKKSVGDSMKQKMEEASFKPDYEYFHADGLQVSGVAIKKDDSRILLVTAGTEAKFFDAKDVISVKSELGTEQDVTVGVRLYGGIAPKNVDKKVCVVDIAVRDLDTPRYKLYFPDKDQMTQWDNRITAWIDMRKFA